MNEHFIERVCPVCGKTFILKPLNIYKLYVKDELKHFCSYTCYRVVQKEREAKEEYKQRKIKRELEGYPD